MLSSYSNYGSFERGSFVERIEFQKQVFALAKEYSHNPQALLVIGSALQKKYDEETSAITQNEWHVQVYARAKESARGIPCTHKWFPHNLLQYVLRELTKEEDTFISRVSASILDDWKELKPKYYTKTIVQLFLYNHTFVSAICFDENVHQRIYLE